MKRSEYRGKAFELWSSDKISGEVYDAMIMNEDAFCEDDDDRDAWEVEPSRDDWDTDEDYTWQQLD